ncbi:hypothetical protein Droror1_Dr00010122 [Drosera rotundifolia]
MLNRPLVSPPRLPLRPPFLLSTSRMTPQAAEFLSPFDGNDATELPSSSSMRRRSSIVFSRSPPPPSDPSQDTHLLSDLSHVSNATDLPHPRISRRQPSQAPPSPSPSLGFAGHRCRTFASCASASWAEERSPKPGEPFGDQRQLRRAEVLGLGRTCRAEEMRTIWPS